MTPILRAVLSAALFSNIAIGSGQIACAATVEESLRALSTVDKDGKGHSEAQRAMQSLSGASAEDLPTILNALDNASPLAANWIRNAFETIADRQLRLKRILPTAKLEAFVRDRSHHPQSRRLAYEWLVKVDPSAADRLIPGMLLDPGAEFRRDAVALRLAQASKLDPKTDKEKAVRLYRDAFSGAVHEDQVKTIASALGKLGQKVDIAEHFAYLMRYSIIGPFDNRGGIGVEAVYPPEKEIRLDATYDGQLGKVSWGPLSTTNQFGIVDIAKQIKPYKGAVMYAVTEFHSPGPQQVELRLSTQNSWKIWLNGKFLFARTEYHRGTMFDQYRVPANMRAGRNLILLKICQDEEKEDWAQTYQFQLRVCDANGTGIRSQSITVSGDQR